MGVPGEPLVGAEEQGVRVALGLELLHGHDDAAVVAHIIVVVPLENLVGVDDDDNDEDDDEDDGEDDEDDEDEDYDEDEDDLDCEV